MNRLLPALACLFGLFALEAEAKSSASRGRPLESQPSLETGPSQDLGSTEVLTSTASSDAPEYSLTVRAKRPPTRAASASVITGETFLALPHRTAEDALRLAPGMSLIQHGSEGKGHQFFLRGFDALHGADLAIDQEGIPINEASNVHGQGYLDLGLIIPEAVSRVELEKGPFSLEAGPFAMAGRADYKLGLNPDRLGLWAGFLVGSTPRERLFLGYSPKSGDGRSFVLAEGVVDAGYGARRGLERVALNLVWDLLPEGSPHRLQLLALGMSSTFQLPGITREEDVRAGRIGRLDSYDLRGKGSSTRGLLGLRYQVSASGRSFDLLAYTSYRRLYLQENFTGFLVHPKDGDLRAQREIRLSYGLKLESQVELNSRTDLIATAGVHGDAIRQAERALGLQQETLSTERALSALQHFAFLGLALDLRLPYQLRLYGALRLDALALDVMDRQHHEPGSAGFLAFSPRAKLSWRPKRWLQFFLAGGLGFRPPEARALTRFRPTWVGSGETLAEGRSPANTQGEVLEAGLAMHVSPWLDLKLTAFQARIRQESIFDHVSGLSLAMGATLRRGLEGSISTRPAPWLELSWDLTQVDARFEASQRPIPLAPGWMSQFAAVLKHDSGLNLGLRALHVGDRPLPHGARAGSIWSVDLSLSIFFQVFEVRLDLENPLGMTDPQGIYHFASSPRSLAPNRPLPVIQTIAGPPRIAFLSLQMWL